jgi:threonylcarbamoyladenosine tRNA methylthiotransferase MtaB
MKYSVLTFGCRVNQADSLAFEDELLARGAEASAPEHADIVVVNSCSVTASADQATRQAIRRVARSNSNAQIVVTGCYATRCPDEVGALPNVVRVVANDDKPHLVTLGLLARKDAGMTTAERFADGNGSCGAAIAPGVAGRTAFTLRVQTGCSEPCAYCIIPSTRGRPRSLPLSEVQRQVDRACAAGFKEIAITGVHLGSYGRDLNPSSSPVALLRALVRKSEAVSCRLLFRVSSLEPMDCGADLVALVAESSSLAPHFHLPLQHASDRILRAMRRPYDSASYARLVDDIRTRIPHASIGSDVIVGFPGERDADVERLASYLEGSPLTHVHVFPYSDRPGTPAASMSDKVHGSAVRERSRRVREISDGLSKRFRASQLGAVRPALTLDDGSVAVTDNYLKVRIPPGLERNVWVDVKLTGDGCSLGEVQAPR